MSLEAAMPLHRREFMAGALAVGLMAMPGMAFAQAVVAAADSNDILRRLLSQATQRAFSRLALPEGFWKSGVARFNLPILFTKTGGNPAGVLADAAFREQLIHRLNNLAESGARGASGPVSDAARKLTFANPQAILTGRPTAATTEMRLQMGTDLLNLLIGPIDQALVATPDPVITQAVAILPGVKTVDVAHAVALSAENGIWYEIGSAEAEIRADPSLTSDQTLIAAFKR
jgi:hypothetical protein